MERAISDVAKARKSAEVAYTALGRATAAKQENLAAFSILVALNHLRDAVYTTRRLTEYASDKTTMAADFAAIEIHSLTGIGNMVAELWGNTVINTKEGSSLALVTSRRNIKEMLKLLDEFARLMSGLISLAGDKLSKKDAIQAQYVLRRLKTCEHS